MLERKRDKYKVEEIPAALDAPGGKGDRSPLRKIGTFSRDARRTSPPRRRTKNVSPRAFWLGKASATKSSPRFESSNSRNSIPRNLDSEKPRIWENSPRQSRLELALEKPIPILAARVSANGCRQTESRQSFQALERAPKALRRRRVDWKRKEKVGREESARPSESLFLLLDSLILTDRSRFHFASVAVFLFPLLSEIRRNRLFRGPLALPFARRFKSARRYKSRRTIETLRLSIRLLRVFALERAFSSFRAPRWRFETKPGRNFS